MQFSIDAGHDKQISVEFRRNSFTGRTTITINGNEQTLKSPYCLSTHFDIEFTKRWEFFTDPPQQSKVVVEEIRPFWFGGFRPHQYNLYVDDLLVLENCGY